MNVLQQLMEAVKQAITMMEIDTPNSDVLDLCYKALHDGEAELRREPDALKEQMTADRKQFLDMRVERDALAESDKRLREEVGNLTRGLDHYRQQWSDVSDENQGLRNDIYEHHSTDCKKFLLIKKVERDAWEKNCNDQIDLLNFTANERDALRAGLAAALDFAGTVAGGASWWEDVWKEHEAAISGEKT